MLFSTLTPACHHTTCPKFGAFALFTLICFESCCPDLFSIQHCILLSYSPDVAASLSSEHHPSSVNNPFPCDCSCFGLPLLVGGVMVLWQTQHPNAVVGPLQVWACWELLGLGAASGTLCLFQPQLTLGGLHDSTPEHREHCTALWWTIFIPSRPVHGALTQETPPTSAVGDLSKTCCLFRTSQDVPARCPGNSDGLNAEMRSGNVGRCVSYGCMYRLKSHFKSYWIVIMMVAALLNTHQSFQFYWCARSNEEVSLRFWPSPFPSVWAYFSGKNTYGIWQNC